MSYICNCNSQVCDYELRIVNNRIEIGSEIVNLKICLSEEFHDFFGNDLLNNRIYIKFVNIENRSDCKLNNYSEFKAYDCIVDGNEELELSILNWFSEIKICINISPELINEVNINEGVESIYLTLELETRHSGSTTDE